MIRRATGRHRIIGNGTQSVARRSQVQHTVAVRGRLLVALVCIVHITLLVAFLEFVRRRELNGLFQKVRKRSAKSLLFVQLISVQKNFPLLAVNGLNDFRDRQVDAIIQIAQPKDKIVIDQCGVATKD